MSPAEADFYRRGLAERKERLEVAARTAPKPEHLEFLLGEVDAALERLETDTFGICETCGGEIEPDLLASDPLVRFCLDDLSAVERDTLEEDLVLASKIQAALLPPRSHRHGGWEICYQYRPRGAVSGDYCDLLTGSSPEDLVMVVGDVSGKGVAASILMAHLHATFRTLVGDEHPFPEVFARANRLFCDSTLPNQYATAVGARLVSEGVEICNAGHPPALLVRRGEVMSLERGGLPLGMFRTVEYESTRLDIGTNDLLVLYSDGLTEAQNAAGDQFGADRLTDVVTRRRGSPAGEVVDACLDELARFTNGRTLDDDLTLLVARRAV